MFRVFVGRGPLLELSRACIIGMCLGVRAVGAQAASPPVSVSQSGSQAVETRAELTTRARNADSLGRHDEAFRLRSRLRDGDFEVGDQIIVQIEGVALTRNDSLIVQDGRLIRLVEPIGDLGLTGVLRSEVSDLIKTRVDRFYKNEVVHVTPLLRLSGGGALRGYYHFRPDLPLTDAIMRMGVGGQAADIKNVEIMRGERTIWASADVQAALSSGLTLAQLQLEPGDEVHATSSIDPAKWAVYLQYGIPIVTALVLLILRQR